MLSGERGLIRAVAGVCLVALVGLMAGCPSGPEEAEGDAADVGAGVDAGDESVDTGEPPSVLDQTALREMTPESWMQGPNEVVPSGVVVEFPRSIRRPNDSLGSETTVRIEPAIEGEWKALADDSLVFEPAESFEPGASYEVIIETLDVRLYNKQRGEVEETVIRPDEPWRETFEMPAFSFLEMLKPVAKVGENQISVDMRFSAKPSSTNLSQWATWTLAGEGHESVSYERGDRPNIVRATLEGVDFQGLDRGAELSLSLSSGVPYSAEITAGASETMRLVAYGEPVDILEVVMREGADGYFVHVICDDDQVDEQTNFYNVHDQHEYEDDFRDISTRCVASLESARNSITFEPEVDFSIAPAEAGFQIHGDFERGKYKMEVKPGLRTVDGGIVDDLKTEEFDVGPLSPQTSLIGTGRYIPPEAWDRLAYRHRNIDKVKVRVRRVPEENVVFWLSGHGDEADRRTSNVVGESTFDVSGEPDEAKTSFLDLSSVVDERTQGVYEVHVDGMTERDDGDGYRTVESDVARMALTDINMIAKRHAEGPEDAWSRTVDVWTVDMKTGQRLSGAKVKAVRPSGFVLGECTTTGGHCELDVQPKQLDPVGPFALVATWRDQLTFLEYQDLETQIPGDVRTGGERYLSEKKYRMSLYGDRDLYRPAETVQVNGVVRTEQLGAVDEGLPVKLTLTDPRGNEATTDVVETNDIGAVDFSYQLGDLAETGQWRLDARIGDRNVESHEFFVEEFVPERMRVNVEPAKPHVVAGESATFDVSAEYLFGASAEGSQVNATCKMRPMDYTPEGWDEYTFGPAGFETEEMSSTDLDQVTAEIGSDGKATVTCDTTELSGARSAKLSVEVSVLEAGSGRSTDEHALAWLHPERHGIGLKTDVDEVEPGDTFTVEGVTTDWLGEKVSSVGNVNVEFIALEHMYSYYYRRRYGHRDRREVRQMVVDHKEVDVTDGEFEVDVPVNHDTDNFAVRVSAGNASSTLQVDIDSWDYWYRGRDDTPRPQMPTEVAVDVDGPAEVNKPTSVTLTSPYRGRALVTVETHQVLRHEWVSVKPGENDWTFTLDEYVPNAYVTAFVVKNPMPDGATSFTPQRAYGVQSVEVAPKQYRGDLQVEAPSEVRPSSEFEVDVSGSLGDGPSYATVAVVDQGILQLTDYQTPEPLEDLLAKRGLSVETFDTIGWNIRSPSLTEPVGGGGAGASGPGAGDDAQGRQMPVEPVALWSGMVKLENGRATIPFDMPHFRGEVRIMAVGMSKSRVAVEETTMKVRDPLGLQTTSPRFLTAGDTARVPVMVTNQTGEEKTIQLEVSSRPVTIPGVNTPGERFGLLKFRNTTTRSVTLADEESASVEFPTYVIGRSGAAKLRVDATTEGHESYTESTIPIQPATPTENKVTTIRVTSIPFADVLNRLEYLISYPYGCVEQTTSSTRPLLYMKSLAESIDPEIIEQHNDIDTMVERGIERVLSMQRSSGGFGYWPGAYGSPDIWDTAFVTDMLIDARNEGYRVPESRVNSALEFLDGEVTDHETSDAAPYGHYVLARAERADRAEIREAIEHWRPDEEDPDYSEGIPGYRRENLYLLKAALYMAGDREYEDELKDISNLYDAAGEVDEDHHWHSAPNYYSPLRRMAVAMAIHQNLFGETEDTDEHITGLVQQMRAEGHLNTQEAMWGVTALGKWVEERDFTDGELRDATLSVGGDEVDPSHQIEGEEISWSVAHAADRDSISLEADVDDASSWFVVMNSRGVRENPTVKFGDHGLEVRREYLNAEGARIDLDQVELGDVVYVRNTLENPTGEEVENVAMVDRIPAGLEVENPRLSGSPKIHDRLVNDDSYHGSPSRGGSWWYEHMNIRDDRVQVFGDIDHHESLQVVYAARATIPGTYQIPTVEAHAMYAPTLLSRQKGRELVIRKPE